MVLFSNATLVLEDGLLSQAYLIVDGEVIHSFGKMPAPEPLVRQASRIIDCHHMYLSPGFVDIHTHG